MADPAISSRTNQLIGLLNGDRANDTYFSPIFRQAVPDARLIALFKELRASLGQSLTVASISRRSPWSADIILTFQRGTASVSIAVDPASPHLVTGLLVTGTTVAGDTLAAVGHEVEALPGTAGFGIYALGPSTPTPVFEVRGDGIAPLGSAFKLWVLGEAARQVAAGQRRWSDVVPLGPRSLGGTVAAWPEGTPVTLQTLATLTISVSDNRATDTLMTALGRTKVDAYAAADGAATPVLSTREMVAIKTDPALTARWAAGDAAARRRLLQQSARAIAASPLDPSIFAGRPVAIEQVEWFGAPRDMARTLDRLRRSGGPVAQAMMAINPGIDPGTAARFAYLGYKGGSEPGVLTLNFLVRTRAGRWFAVSGNWHRSDAAVEEARFVGLMSRALALLADR